MEKIQDYLYEQGDYLNSEDETGLVSCMDRCCCCSCSCNLCGENKFEKKELMSAALRQVRGVGVSLISLAIFPLLQDIIRDVWVTIELIAALAGLALSATTYKLSTETQGFDLARMIFVAVSSFLAIVDSVYTLRQCKTCKRCRGKADHREGDDKEESRCYKCCSCFKNTLDLVRMLVTEAVIYPLLICNIIDVVIGRGYLGNTPRETAGFALFVFSCVFVVLYVYIARLLVLIGIVKNLTRMNPNTPAFCYLLFFLLHVFLQMLVQIFMLVSIGAKLRYDNRHLYEPDNVDDSINISSELIYMMCAGYVVPFLGFFTFFVVTYYWSQEFPIGFVFSILKLCRMRSCGKDDIMNTFTKRSKQNIEAIEASLETSDVKEEFDQMSGVMWITKFLYPFKTPVLIVFSLIYSGLLLGFYICGAVSFTNNVDGTGTTIVVEILGGGGWWVFYIVTGFVLAISNLYVLLVAGVWFTIICIIVTMIAAAIVGYIIYLFLRCACRDDTRYIVAD